jgi:hypothetical protein
MNTATAPNIQPDGEDSEAWPALVPDIPGGAREPIDARSTPRKEARSVPSHTTIPRRDARSDRIRTTIRPRDAKSGQRSHARTQDRD